MRVLLILLAAFVAALQISELDGAVLSDNAQLLYFSKSIEVVLQLIEEKCADDLSRHVELGPFRIKREILSSSLNLAIKQRELAELHKFLLTCHKIDGSVKADSTTVETATKPVEKSTAAVTTISSSTTGLLPISCEISKGYLTVNLDLVQYSNPSDNKATGIRCDLNTSCDVYFEICISHLGSSDCDLLSTITEVIAENTQISFSPDVGGLRNPISLSIPTSKWMGVNLQVTVWDHDPRSPAPDQIDEFSVDLIDEPGSEPWIVTALGLRPEPKSRLDLYMRILCPLSTTTTPTTTSTTTSTTTPTTTPRTTPTTTPTTTLTTTSTTTSTTTPTTTPTTTSTTIPITTPTTPPTTTVDPQIAQICQEALVFNESWRMDNQGSIIRPANCDIKAPFTTNRPWFRFGGSAGRYLLDTCPPENSCGTVAGIYSDAQPVNMTVGTQTPFTAYGSFSNNCRRWSFSMLSMKCYNGDIIYRYTDPQTGLCSYGFCGME